jgi:purine-nucleoside phosphorylase
MEVNMFNINDYKISADFIKSKIGDINPKVAIVLGTGLGVLKDDFSNLITIDYKSIPLFPLSTVSGHASELLIGTINNVPVLAMNGRFHYYEGYSLEEITYPIRVFKLLGIENLLLTNAAGGINLNFNVGDFMIIDDHLSFFADSVLRGKNIDEFGPRFPQMSELYNKTLSNKLFYIANKYTHCAHRGIYSYMKGPAFETPAEIKALRILGADAVGMSTVPEAIIASHCGMQVAGISCITNMASGINEIDSSHDDVQATANSVKYIFKNIVKDFITEL